jgi:hypothetical protein
MTQHLFIVARQRPDLFGFLSREFSSEADVRVMMDRRGAERRRHGERRASARGDRRQTDRRGARSETSEQLTSLGYAFVRQG